MQELVGESRLVYSYQSIKMIGRIRVHRQLLKSCDFRVLCERKRLNHVDFVEDFQKNHIETSFAQKCLLTLGASAASLLDPSRGDMIATLGETSGLTALKHVRVKMMESPEGSEILGGRPRINTKTVDMSYLARLPENTVGKVYSDFLVNNKVTPDSRPSVQFVDDVELAYVMQRYREVHDLVHAILFMPTNMLGEVTVKWVEGLQTRLPMCLGGGLFGAVRLKPKQRQKYITVHLPWAVKTGMTANFLMNVYFEKRWEQSIDELHRELNIQPLPREVSFTKKSQSKKVE